MRCKSCNYLLWQISSRVCPECGTPFKPSEFEFVPNSVRYCCPHCEQAYYGTSPTGHLVPTAFECVNCHKPIDMDQMVLLPAEGVRDEQTEADEMLWLERGRRYGAVKAWFKTVWQAMIMPHRLMRVVPAEAGVGAATWFAILTLMVILMVSTLPLMLLVLLPMLVATGGRGGGGGVSAALGMGAGFLMIAGAGLVLSIFAMLFTLLLGHALLRLTGKIEYGIGRTWQALCYSTGANVGTAIPCLGAYFGWIWWLVSAVLMVKTAQNVSGRRAAFAILTPPLLMIGTFVGGYAFFIYWAVTSSGAGFGASSAYSMGMQPQVQGMAMAIRNHASPSGGPLDHAARLLVDQEVPEIEFFDYSDWQNSGWMGRMNTILIGGRTLNQWQSDPRSTKDAAADRAAAELPADTVAYRIGDMVFTHRGFDPGKANAQDGSDKLWVVVGWPESLSKSGVKTTTGGSTSVTSSRQMVTVGYADGSTGRIQLSAMDAQLTEENTLRKKLGLPVIPHPADVKITAPARAGDAAEPRPDESDSKPDGQEPDATEPRP